jgi:hypothetical protein
VPQRCYGEQQRSTVDSLSASEIRRREQDIVCPANGLPIVAITANQKLSITGSSGT